MKEKEIRSSIKTVYGMLWDVLALYEKTECYNKVPEGEKEADIWDLQYRTNKSSRICKDSRSNIQDGEYINAKACYWGRAFIEYCISCIFNIHRLPGCGYDRYEESLYHFFDLELKEVDDACSELKELYKFTQKN